MLRRSTFDRVYEYCYSRIESGEFALDAEAVEQDLAHLIRQQPQQRERDRERKSESEQGHAIEPEAELERAVEGEQEQQQEREQGYGCEREGEQDHDRPVTPVRTGAAARSGGSRSAAAPGPADFEAHERGAAPLESRSIWMSLDLDVVTSIFRSCYKGFMKANARLFRVDAAKARKFLDLWRRGAEPPSLLMIARQHKLPPMKVAKAVLNTLNIAKPPLAAEQAGPGSSAESAAADALSSRTSPLPNHSKPLVKVEDNTSLLAFDPRLRRDIEECVAMDRFEGPDSEIERQSIGQEYEYILQETLRNIGVPFQLEGHLREQGLVATPDTLLVVPAVVHNPVTNQSHVVNWIESKAMFGDPAQHKDNFYQLEKYVERYGPGMVVYWFGYVEGLNNPNDDGWPWDDLILVVSRIPPEMRAR